MFGCDVATNKTSSRPLIDQEQNWIDISPVTKKWHPNIIDGVKNIMRQYEVTATANKIAIDIPYFEMNYRAEMLPYYNTKLYYHLSDIYYEYKWTISLDKFHPHCPNRPHICYGAQRLYIKQYVNQNNVFAAFNTIMAILTKCKDSYNVSFSDAKSSYNRMVRRYEPVMVSYKTHKGPLSID